MSSKKYKILLTCDDGIRSNALIELYHELSEIAEVVIIAPHDQRSAEGKAITINQIVRLENEILPDDIKAYSINGTSADAVIFGVNVLQEGPFDLVVAGINQGYNISSHIILTSGTCAAAFEASYYGIPAIAFSMDVPPTDYFAKSNPETFKKTAKLAAKMVERLLGKDFPENLAFLNVNFPLEASEITPIKVTNVAKKFLNFQPEQRKDPRNNDYYFIWGEAVREIQKGTDLEAIANGLISISPITNNLSCICQGAQLLIKELLQ
ncbi:MAG: 5'/3'-nucleotidase SurE [Asgard group archaeon]|nr:5'/3'-nucleotidase SurE [Asgard group archaeon]